MFIGTFSMEHDRHISVMQSAVTETEEVKWTENLNINDKVVTCKLVTGTDCSAMSVKTFNALEVGSKLRPNKSKLVAFFGQKIAPRGK